MPDPPSATLPRLADGRKIRTTATPYSQQWNFTVQRQLMDDMTLDVGMWGMSTSGRFGYDPINSALTPGPGDIQARRLLPAYGDLDGGENKFSSAYNSMR